FRIVSEGAIAAGIRRIEATTGENAENIAYAAEDSLLALRELFKNSPNVLESAKRLLMENEQFKKEAEQMLKERCAAIKDKVKEKAEKVNGFDFMVLQGPFNMELLKTVAFILKKECTNTIFVGAGTEQKPSIALMYSDDLVAKGMNAGKDIREAAKFINGGGGGQASFASAGGKDASGITGAIECIRQIISKL
ncbi:MAG: alanine--tRNA ligase, partial [Bacteroidales bacterium]|nr:alanine--tRNA ligase [Bacteroidales bacterium]